MSFHAWGAHPAGSPGLRLQCQLPAANITKAMPPFHRGLLSAGAKPGSDHPQPHGGATQAGGCVRAGQPASSVSMPHHHLRPGRPRLGHCLQPRAAAEGGLRGGAAEVRAEDSGVHAGAAQHEGLRAGGGGGGVWRERLEGGESVLPQQGAKPQQVDVQKGSEGASFLGGLWLCLALRIT